MEISAITLDQIILDYQKQFDFYEQFAKLVQTKIDKILKSNAIRAIITSRAKDPKQLHEKITRKQFNLNNDTEVDIYTTIKDLAGVRVALYFPSV